MAAFDAIETALAEDFVRRLTAPLHERAERAEKRLEAAFYDLTETVMRASKAHERAERAEHLLDRARAERDEALAELAALRATLPTPRS